MTGRPGKEYRTNSTLNEIAEYAFLTEIPIKEAMSGSMSADWMQAMSTEVRSILKNCTWNIVDRPKDYEVIGSRFVLHDKYDLNGELKKRKARIAARGFSQRPSMDFHDLCTSRTS